MHRILSQLYSCWGVSLGRVFILGKLVVKLPCYLTWNY